MLVAAGGDLFGLALDAVREVVPARPYTRLPGAAAFVCGVINFRGRVLTVLDLGGRVERPACAARPDHRVVVVAYRDREIGLAVEEVIRILAVTEDALSPLAHDDPRAELAGAPTHAGRLDHLEFRTIDIESLLEPVFG